MTNHEQEVPREDTPVETPKVPEAGALRQPPPIMEPFQANIAGSMRAARREIMRRESYNTRAAENARQWADYDAWLRDTPEGQAEARRQSVEKQQKAVSGSALDAIDPLSSLKEGNRSLQLLDLDEALAERIITECPNGALAVSISRTTTREAMVKLAQRNGPVRIIVKSQLYDQFGEKAVTPTEYISSMRTEQILQQHPADFAPQDPMIIPGGYGTTSHVTSYKVTSELDRKIAEFRAKLA